MTSSANYDNAVQELYVTYFGRPADPGGLTNFAAALAAADAPTDLAGLTAAYDTNAGVKSLIDSFGTSAESVKLYGDTSTQSGVQGFVNEVFQNLFGRAANADGLAFWSNAILSGSLTQGDAALAIAAGAEQNTTAQGKLDAQGVSNKVTVASQFTSALLTQQDISAYSGAAAAQEGRALLGMVTSASDTSTFGGTITSTIADIINPTTNLGLYLTTGVDRLVGNSGNDAFFAVIDNAAGLAAGGQAATLNPGDSLIGSSPNNSLYLVDDGVGGYFALPTGITLTNVTELDLTAKEAVGDPGMSNGAFDFSKSGFKTVDVLQSYGTSAVKVAPGTTLQFNVAQGSVTTYGGAKVYVEADASIQNMSSPENVIHGDASTTTVGVVSGFTFLVQDANYGKGHPSTISTVYVEANNTSTTIDSDALTQLSTTYDDYGSQVIVNAAAGTRSLAVSMNEDANLTITDQTATALAVTTATAASTGMTLQFGSAGSVSVAAAVDLGVANLYAPQAGTVTLSGSGNLSFSSVTLESGAKIDASALTGNLQMTLLGSVGFTGGSGTDTISIGAAPSSAIVGGSAGNNEIILDNFAGASAGALSQVSHFATLGVAGSTSGTFDLATMSGIATLDLRGSSGNETFTDLTSSIHVGIGNAGNVNLTLQTADSHGASDTQSIYIGSSTSYSNLISQLTVEDAVGNGVATLNLISNAGLQVNYGIGTLTDPGLSFLNLTGAATIKIEAPIASFANQMSIASSAGSSADYVAGVTDAALSSLSVAGGVPLSLGTIITSVSNFSLTDGNNAGFTMSGISDAQLSSATFTNNSMSTMQFTSNFMSFPALTQLNLNGNVSISFDGGMSPAGMTISGATDNGNLNYFTQATLAAGNTDSITLGNGSHFITLGGGFPGSTQTLVLGDGAFDINSSTSGVFNLTAGTGSGYNTVSALGGATAFNVTLGNGTNQIQAGGSLSVDISVGSGANTITVGHQGVVGQIGLAAHSAADQITVGALGSNLDLTHIIAISGLNNNGLDSIAFGDYNSASVVAGGMQQVSAADVTGDPSQLASWVAAAVGQGGLVPQVAHGVNWFQFGGNTYLVQTPSASDAGVVNAADTVVELTGLGYTFANAATIGGYLILKG